MVNMNDFIPQVRFELIPIKDLVSSQDYQRRLSDSQIAYAVEDFDVHQINPVKVSQRDGINYVVDGQHTVEIVARASGSRETPVWCMISEDLDYTGEADVFANQAKHSRPLTSYEVFIGHIEAGNHEQLTIRDLVESYGLQIGPSKKPGMICAISALEFIYEHYGYHVLNRTLLLVVGTWEGDMNSFTGNILRSTAKLIVTYGDTLNNATFKEKLGDNSPRALSRMAKERRPGSMGYAEAMVLMYNGKKKPGSDYYLDMQKLASGARATRVVEEDAAAIEAAEKEIAERSTEISAGFDAVEVVAQESKNIDAQQQPQEDFDAVFRNTFFPDRTEANHENNSDEQVESGEDSSLVDPPDLTGDQAM